MKNVKVNRWLILHDIHYPLTDWPTWNCMMDMAHDIKFDGIIIAGDGVDNAEIAHHNKGKALFKERGSYKKNSDGFDKTILTPLEQALPKHAKKVYIWGNHERFEQDLIEEHPELEHMLDHAALWRLKERNWQVVPLGHSYKLGELNVIHGEILTGIGNQAGAFPSKKAVEMYGSNVLAGHTHSPQSYSKVSPVDAEKRFMAWIAPVLCNTNPQYLRNRPTAWVNGWTVVEVQNNGLFNCYPIICINGTASFGGKLYSGK